MNEALIWQPAADIADEYNNLTDLEKVAVQLVVYNLLNKRLPLTMLEKALVDQTMQLPIAVKLRERCYDTIAA